MNELLSETRSSTSRFFSVIFHVEPFDGASVPDSQRFQLRAKVLCADHVVDELPQRLTMVFIYINYNRFIIWYDAARIWGAVP